LFRIGADYSIALQYNIVTVNVLGVGEYVFTRRPLTKQIQLKSSISGVKNFDYVVEGESHYDDNGVMAGRWFYLADGTNLSDILEKEMDCFEMGEQYFGWYAVYELLNSAS